MTVFDKHQLRIAKATLKMSDAGALIMGGMTKDQARGLLGIATIEQTGGGGLTVYGLKELCEYEGMNIEEIAQESMFGARAGVPGICPHCGYTTDVEPDQDRGWCEECEAQTVKSALILAGIM